MNDTTYAAFRQEVYGCFHRQAGALQNLLDGLLTQDTAHSLPELSFSSAFTRRWPSVYTALQDGKIDRDALRQVLGRYAPVPSDDRLLLLNVKHIPRRH